MKDGDFRNWLYHIEEFPIHPPNQSKAKLQQTVTCPLVFSRASGRLFELNFDIFYDLIGRYDYFGYFGLTTNAYHPISLLGDCFKTTSFLEGLASNFLKFHC